MSRTTPKMTSNKHICNEGGKENVWPSEIDEDGGFYFSKKKRIMIV